QLAALERDSRKHGTTGDDIDFALLVDGLEAEREQGITIDVAYRFFATPKRKFIVADTPGHEQYTRNMATGASTADLAIVLVDAAVVDLPFRFPVQYVNRPNLDFRGFAGTIASGAIAPGDEIVVAKSGKSSRVKRIVSYGGDLAQAAAGQAVTLVLDDEVEIS